MESLNTACNKVGSVENGARSASLQRRPFFIQDLQLRGCLVSGEQRPYFYISNKVVRSFYARKEALVVYRIDGSTAFDS
jgi:hypothetical protein